jgi:hypothetical protein
LSLLFEVEARDQRFKFYSHALELIQLTTNDALNYVHFYKMSASGAQRPDPCPELFWAGVRKLRPQTSCRASALPTSAWRLTSSAASSIYTSASASVHFVSDNGYINKCSKFQSRGAVTAMSFKLPSTVTFFVQPVFINNIPIDSVQHAKDYEILKNVSNFILGGQLGIFMNFHTPNNNFVILQPVYTNSIPTDSA